MRRLALLLLCGLAIGRVVAAPTLPHLDLDVRLDPSRRSLEVTAELRGGAAGALVGLDRALRIADLAVAGHPVTPPPAGEVPVQRVQYRGTLAPLGDADARQVLGWLPAMASAEGSFLPAGSGWYPDPGGLFTYRLRLHLPPGQRGLVPGRLLRESDGESGYTAEFEFMQPGEGIDLMAGPYRVDERLVRLDSGREVRLRTWFHSELADLAEAYLDDSERYLRRYDRLIGAYPFDAFSIVSSPLPTGFGMPTLTYLGRRVLRLPFIRATSLGHEVLHNWWGNGVYPDWQTGNWAEGLTTFLADYAYQEDRSPAAAAEARLGWLRDLAAVPESADLALRDFVARRHGISSIVGYNKSAMLFFMLRDRIGSDAFGRGLRLFWERQRFRHAAWSDLRAAFEEASGVDLGAFFGQWVDRPGAPHLRLLFARRGDDGLEIGVANSGVLPVRVPLRLRGGDGQVEERWVEIAGGGSVLRLNAPEWVGEVELDPEFRIWRRVDPGRFPAILREVLVAPQVGLVLADAEPNREWRAAATVLAGRMLDHPPVSVSAKTPATTPLLLIGHPAAVDAWLDARDLPGRPPQLAATGSAQVWAGRDMVQRPYVVVSAPDTASLTALQRALPHYGRQSWLIFDDSRVVDKGIWPGSVEAVAVTPANP